ncbi:hypothetical protein GWK47_005287 [Chionoecetes opilio]|uniref:Uncharacterized protein n=1 Tax=Chionoecetes opilio TaxID=41210 RepID=A0A8J4YB87_CHIOP|nr:hypothetical protein GWK47_005287 [Chionoecetes opilio]
MDKTYQDAFHELGRSWKMSPELFEKLQEITCHMYLPSTHTTEVNKLRYELFLRDVERWSQVNSLLVRTASSCMHYVPKLPGCDLEEKSAEPAICFEPTDCGWMTDEDGKLAVNWMRGSPAPDAVMQLLSCKCVRSCELPKCTCLSNGLKCTDMCGYRHARTRLLKKSR